MPESNSIRLQKFLAECGLGSRRACENLILDGLVSIDGRTITKLGTRIDPAKQVVRYKTQIITKEPSVTLLVNKPPKVICTSNDPQGRTTVLDLLSDLPERVYTVGRLDFMSEGLILVTNDGELAHALMHPRYHIEKTYRVWIDQPLGHYQLQKIIRGIPNQGETLRALSIEAEPTKRKGTLYRIILGEGRNRHIRRLMEHFNRNIFRLQRIAIGPLQLDRLKEGAWRPARPAELKLLRKAIAEKQQSHS